MPASDRPFVTIVMPALNEERFIASAIASLMPREDVAFCYELLVVDGGSTDATVPIVQLIARGNPAVRLIPNERRLQAAGFNRAAEMASPQSDVLVRADCHAAYPGDFVERCVEAIMRTRAASIVVPMHTRGTGCVQRAIAAAQNSRLGNGGAAHRRPGQPSRFVDHGHHAAFRRRQFLAVGGYDETFPANEDAEFDRRLVAAGWRIWLEDEAAITYFPREDFRSLARQYAAYGLGRARTAMTHGGLPRMRQLLPVAAVLGCALALLLAPADPRFLFLIGLYAAACLSWGALLAARAASPCLLLTGVAAMTMHLAWGYGFLRGIASGWRRRDPLTLGGNRVALDTRSDR